MGAKILLTGGVRGGKSRAALRLARAVEGQKYFLATADARDVSMQERVAAHRRQRADASFVTIEEPLAIDTVIKAHGDGAVIVIDCLTLWCHNLFFHLQGDRQVRAATQQRFLEAFTQSTATLIVVTNEVGWGIIPDNRLCRDYMDALGALNQEVARACDQVVLMVAGVAQWVKGQDPRLASFLESF